MGGFEILYILVGIGLMILFGVISMKQAEKKGYPKVGFFCLGFFVGLIGLIIALCVPDRTQSASGHSYTQQAASQQEQQQAWQQQTSAPQVSGSDQAANTPDAWTCESCGTRNAGGNFCNNCGTAKPQ